MEINGKPEKIILPRPPGLGDGSMCRCGRGMIPTWDGDPIQNQCCFCQDERDVKRNAERQKQNESRWTPDPEKKVEPTVSENYTDWNNNK